MNIARAHVSAGYKIGSPPFWKFCLKKGCFGPHPRFFSVNTMVYYRFILLSLSFSMVFFLTNCEESLETRSPEDPIKTQEEKELIEALQEVLEKLKNKRMPSTEKKLGWVPSCDAGEQCAVRKGARIGKLCNCPRGTSCNFSILKCF